MFFGGGGCCCCFACRLHICYLALVTLFRLIFIELQSYGNSTDVETYGTWSNISFIYSRFRFYAQCWLHSFPLHLLNLFDFNTSIFNLYALCAWCCFLCFFSIHLVLSPVVRVCISLWMLYAMCVFVICSMFMYMSVSAFNFSSLFTHLILVRTQKEILPTPLFHVASMLHKTHDHINVLTAAQPIRIT